MELDAGNENEVLCEKIISDIHAVFLKDAYVSSFEIIPTILNRNKSPVVHSDHHLGLESWCTKHVYDHAHKSIISYRRQNPQRYLQHSEVLIKYLNVALLINPDVTTFWHVRRQMVQTNHLKINREFKFSALILSKKPKSSESFTYRRWLFSFQSHDAIDWPSEIGICDRSADRSPNNYHAWTHRQWVLQNSPDLIRSELMMTEKFIRKHISDYSSYHYRQAVITHAYEMCYYDPDELTHLQSLKELIGYYLADHVEVCSDADILQILLPGVDQKALGEPRLQSFLYCCNLAAHDILLCVDQRNMYGERESFENHRRASLRFIVEHCVRLLLGERPGLYLAPRTQAQLQQFSAELHKFNYGAYAFLGALKRSESLLGEKHRKWCAIFLGFNYA